MPVKPVRISSPKTVQFKNGLDGTNLNLADLAKTTMSKIPGVEGLQSSLFSPHNEQYMRRLANTKQVSNTVIRTTATRTSLAELAKSVGGQ